MVYRVYVEKKPEIAHEAKSLLKEANELLSIKGLEDVRIILNPKTEIRQSRKYE